MLTMVKTEQQTVTPKFQSLRHSEGTGETETDQVSLSNTERNLLKDSCDDGEQEDFFGNHDDTAFFQAIWDDHARKSGGSATSAIGESILSAGDENNNGQCEQDKSSTLMLNVTQSRE